MGRRAAPITSCPNNQKMCSGGCVPTNDPQYGCAATGCAPCSIANATPQCYQGACALLSCDPGYGDCNTDLGDGCEQQLDTTTDCGDCGRACGSQHSSSASCSAGACSHVCEPGYGDCSQPTSGPDNGCETNFATDNGNCGGCSNDCTAQGAGNGFSCNSGVCGCTASAQCEQAGGVNGTCDTGTGLCTCGTTACQAGEACIKDKGSDICSCNGKAACQSGETCCQSPGGCKHLQTDEKNCGGCGRACDSGQSCVAGQCQ